MKTNLKRRKFLIATGLATTATLAGCTGNAESDTDNPSGDEGSEQEGLIIQSVDDKTTEYSLTIYGQAVNKGPDELSYATLKGRFYDSAGAIISDSMANISDLPVGQAWNYEIPFLGMDYSNVAQYDVIVDQEISY